MRDDLYGWNEIPAPENETLTERGRIRVRATAPVNLIVSVGGVEVLAGSGQEVSVTVQEAVSFRAEPVEPGSAVRVWWYSPFASPIHTAGPVHTNIDRKPLEVGHLAEVRKELRVFELRQRALRDAIRKERLKLEAARGAVAASGAETTVEEPVTEPAPETVAEPVSETVPESTDES